jgi:MFS family permease
MNGYTLTLAAFLLIGGSLGNRFGRRKVYVIGIVWFALASMACGLAPAGARARSSPVRQVTKYGCPTSEAPPLTA